MLNISQIKVKYELLNYLFKDYIKNIIYSNTVNLIIDLREFMSKFFQIDLEVDNEKLFVEELASDILSTIGYYRWYFYKNNKYTNIYLIWPKKVPSYFRNIDPTYESHFEEKYLTGKYSKYVSSAVKTVEMICEYIPNCTFIDSSDFGSWVYIYHLATTTSEYMLNVILGGNLVNTSCLNNHTIMLKLSGDDACIYTERNTGQRISGNKYMFSSKLVPIYLSLVGKRNLVNGIKGIGTVTACKLITNAIEKLEISDIVYYSFPVNELTDPIVKEHEALLLKNYRLLFPIQVYMSNQFEIKNRTVLVKKQAVADTFFDLNDDVFSNYNIPVDGLLAGEIKTK